MCNPRRVEVTATRAIAQAWEREVRRSASRTAEVRGEVRIRQPLDASASAGVPGWTPLGDGYR
jgi:hypothetical protein